MDPGSLDFVDANIAGAWRPPFRGEIYEYARKLDLQKGYAVKGNFDIDTARHLVEPLRAIRDPRVRIVSLRGAVQTLKSLVADIVVPYWIEHDPGDCLWLFEDDPKAKLYADTRAMPLIKSVPEISEMLQDVDRHDNTKTKIIFRHMNLVVAGLNEGNVQSISYRYVIIDEGWMAKSNGLIRQAMARTTQYPVTKKILLIGQGGIENDDADIEHLKTDQRVLTYACPACGHRQPFELAKLRPDDFAIEKIRGTYAGLSWDTNETTRPEGKWNEQALKVSAHHRCFACDHRIGDMPAVRRQLAESYAYQVTNTGAPADRVGFTWPAEASPRISFGELAMEYLRAKEADETLAYRLPLQEFYQKRRGISWKIDMGHSASTMLSGSYDPKEEWKEGWRRILLVDCQQELTHFWVSAHEIARNGESRQLQRGCVLSLSDVAKIQAAWKIPDQLVFLDAGHRQEDLVIECAKHGHWVNAPPPRGRVWFGWNLLKGSGLPHFPRVIKTRNGRILKRYRSIVSEETVFTARMGKEIREVRMWNFSALHCADMARRYRDGDKAPKCLFLPETDSPENDLSWTAQLHSEIRVKRPSRQLGGIPVYQWVPKKQQIPNHAWDLLKMMMAVIIIGGLVQGTSVADATAAEEER